MNGHHHHTHTTYGSNRNAEQIVTVDEDRTAVSSDSSAPDMTTPLLKHKTSRQSHHDDDTTSICSGHSNASSNSHMEPHFAGAEIVRVRKDLSDGLTVPFAMAAALTNTGSTQLVVVAGMAEIVAGAISMGWIEHYEAEWKRELMEIATVPEREEQEIVDIFRPYGMDRKDVEPLLTLLRADPINGLEKPDASRSWISAFTIGFSYFMGGLVPLFPYMLVADAMLALWISVATTLFVLLVFGYIKAKLLGVPRPVMSAFSMMMVGATAAGVAFGVAKLINDGGISYFTDFKLNNLKLN
ncbi:VIT family-domain-containing protein [Chytridium lagenaria]|nr:VIT family-domain-containing protein [Chytridium lagenaria]